MDPPTTSTHLSLPTLLSPTFDAVAHANDLMLKTHQAGDPPPLDLSTPLSRALFDAQEVDGLIDALTTRHAVEILTWTRRRDEAAGNLLRSLVDGEERAKVNDGFARLWGQVVGRWEKGQELGTVAGRGVEVVRLLRAVAGVLAVARRVEGCIVGTTAAGMVEKNKWDDHGRFVDAAYAIWSFREIMLGAQGVELGKVNLVKLVRGKVLEDGEEKIRDWARKVIREFNAAALGNAAMAAGGNPLLKDAETARAKFTDACRVLYILSPAPLIEGRKMKREEFEPELLLRSLQGYVQSAVQASGAGIARGLATLPQLDKVLVEVSSRCQSVVAMEKELARIREPRHPMLAGGERRDRVDADDDANGEEEGEDGDEHRGNMLQPLLHALDTSSLPSYFWRSLASGLGSRVQEILNRGGVSARTLRTNRDRVRDEIRECVLRGSKMPTAAAGGDAVVLRSWEREAAVMVGSVMGPLSR